MSTPADSLSTTTSLLDRANLDRDSVRHQVARGLAGADDGEMFLEYSQTEALMFDNGRLKQATYDTSQGFGLRAVKDDAVGYAHSSDVSLPALIRAADAVAAVRGGYSGTFAAPPAHTNVRLYGDENPLDAPGFESKVKLLAEIDAYVRDKDPRVRQVTVSLGATWQVVEILRPDGESYRDSPGSGGAVPPVRKASRNLPAPPPGHRTPPGAASAPRTGTARGPACQRHAPTLRRRRRPHRNSRSPPRGRGAPLAPPPRRFASPRTGQPLVAAGSRPAPWRPRPPAVRRPPRRGRSRTPAALRGWRSVPGPADHLPTPSSDPRTRRR